MSSVNLELRRALFAKKDCNPDDLVQCPFVPSEWLKRKTLISHLPRCRAKNGAGFLQCQYSQLHFFKTQRELSTHELVCPMRLQLSGTASIAPPFETKQDATEVPDLVSRQCELVVQRQELEKKYFEPANQNGHWRADWESFASKYPWLQALDGSPGKAASETKGLAGSPHGLRADDPTPSGSGSAKNPLKNTLGYDYCRTMDETTGAFGLGFKFRFENCRDSQEPPKHIDYRVDWTQIPFELREPLRRKYARDNRMYKTGMNPRYRKENDVPDHVPSQIPDPLEYEKFAFWFEDLLSQTAQHH